MMWRLLSCYYSLPCPSWLSKFVEMDNPFFKVTRAKVIVEHLDLADGMVVVDIGCGPGRLTIPVARAVGPKGLVVALDIQEAMLLKTKKTAEKAGLINVTFVKTAMEQNILERNKFDRALLVSVLGEIPNREAALKEVFDVLKPGGILSVTEIICDPHFQRRSVVRELACKIGFQEKNAFGNCSAFTLNFEKPLQVN